VPSSIASAAPRRDLVDSSGGRARRQGSSPNWRVRLLITPNTADPGTKDAIVSRDGRNQNGGSRAKGAKSCRSFGLLLPPIELPFLIARFECESVAWRRTTKKSRFDEAQIIGFFASRWQGRYTARRASTSIGRHYVSLASAQWAAERKVAKLLAKRKQ
jgi:hypothetical protein